MSVKGWPWVVLDLSNATTSTAEVRRAYARKLKTINQATDIAGFETLRKAYEAALARTEQKARKAATSQAVTNTKAQVDMPIADRRHAPDHGSEPSAESTPAPLSLEIVPNPEPPGPASEPLARTQSPAKRLEARLRSLYETSPRILIADRAIEILTDSEFQSSELEPQLRKGMAQYLRSQLILDHHGEPYLRHRGVTSELVRILDQRFDWLNDYSVFRQDFAAKPQLLDAMIDVAGLSKAAPEAVLIPDSGLELVTGLLSGPWYAILFFGSLAALDSVSDGANRVLDRTIDPTNLNSILFLLILSAFSWQFGWRSRRPKGGFWIRLTPLWIGCGAICELLTIAERFDLAYAGGFLWIWLGISLAILLNSWIMSFWALLGRQLRDFRRSRIE